MKHKMRVLIACEFSGVEREAFRELGHDAWSCDLLPADDASPYHHQGDVVPLLAEPWDLVVAHPPCTYLANSGVRWLWTAPGVPDMARWQAMNDGAQFFSSMFAANTSRLCVENPIQHRYAMSAHGQGRPDQYVQPYEYGHMETKRTGYWLRGLPPLVPTTDLQAATLALPERERARVHYASPGPDRWKIRSTSFPGIAQAMADQWGRE